MRRYLVAAAVTAAAATLTGAAPGAGALAGAEAQAAPGARLWLARYNSGPGSYDAADAIAVSPGGSTVFVTGNSWPSGPTGRDYATLAYSAATGRQLWVRRYSGPGQRTDIPCSVAVSPDGSRVFVTGGSTVRPHSDAYATIAYAAATGRQLWLRRYQGPANGNSDAAAMAVSPDGRRVFVTGGSDGAGGGSGGYATVAYSAATGRQLWARPYSPRHGSDYGGPVAVSPGGATVFVTGETDGAGGAGAIYATVAYSAATGRQLWVGRRHEGYLRGMAVRPDGTAVYVTATSGGGFLTVADSAATGTQLWASRHSNGDNGPVAVSPDGTTVYVTGTSRSDQGYATIAYSAATGRQLWASRYRGPANLGYACCLAVSPDGTAVFATGESYGGQSNYDYATIAYHR